MSGEERRGEVGGRPGGQATPTSGVHATAEWWWSPARREGIEGILIYDFGATLVPLKGGPPTRYLRKRSLSDGEVLP